MKIKVNYLENVLILNDSNIISVEIENKKYFYRFVNDLKSLSDLDVVEDITFFNENNEEINAKFKMFINYFDFEFDSKKYTNDINKYIINEMNENDKNILFKNYNKLIDSFLKILNKSDLPLQVLEDISIENIVKNLKLSINSKTNLLDNLLLLVELEKVLKTYNILIFINLKQYLTSQELIELYKYSIYNKVNIILIDSQCYGCTLDYEKKLIIDSNLDEIMI